MTTLIDRSPSGRVRMVPHVEMMATGPVCPSVHARVPASTPLMPTALLATTADTNLWLGGDAQVPGNDSDFAIKRIAPGRPGGMT